MSDVEYGEWRKSSRSSDSANCVEVAVTSDGIALRDSKNPDGGTLHLSRDDWSEFVAKVRIGEYDLAP